MTNKIQRQDCQPLIDKLYSQFSSWTVRHFSFAGHLQPLKSVIYYTISFWASIFLLPNRCLKILEQMSNSFLWKGVPTGVRGAKVSWEIVCTSKESGGLGLRRLSLWKKIMGLKLIWLLFASSGSLWVSWTRLHRIGFENFWTLDPDRSGSWLWQSLCKLRQLARPFVVCEIGSGITGSFLFDNWTSLGLLIGIVGGNAPRLIGLAETASVREALVGEQWWLNSSRSRNSVVSSEEDDQFLWKIGENSPKDSFSSSYMRNHLYNQLPAVPWHKSVWFTGMIPKHAFIAWLVAHDRLSTRDRMIRWGSQVSPLCPLCDSANECKQHLFFDCSYSKEVWYFFYSRLHLSLPPRFEDGLSWITAVSRDKNYLLSFSFLSKLHSTCSGKKETQGFTPKSLSLLHLL